MTPLILPEQYITHVSCRACGSDALNLLVDFGPMPLAGGFMLPVDVANRNVSYPLRLARCADCTLMQILDSVPPEIIFSQYSYITSATRTMLEHYTQMGAKIVESFSAKDKLIVEFGCNDGVFLRSVLRAGAHAIGVDPSDVARRASEREGWRLFNTYFNEEVARQIRREYGCAKIVAGNNVFAHVDDLHAVLRGVVALLEEDGVFIIEVYYQGDLISKTQFDTVYHEHVCYYSLTSLVLLLSQYDLKAVDVERLPTHSGSIRVTAARRTSSYAPSTRVDEMLAAEKTIDVEDFVRRVLQYPARFQGFIEGLKKKGKTIGAYGAAGRMTVLVNYCGLGPQLLEYAVDMSPLRHGRLVPGVLLPIVPPSVFHENPLDYMIMSAWSYEAEILEKESGYIEAGGQFIIPLPDIRVIGASPIGKS